MSKNKVKLLETLKVKVIWTLKNDNVDKDGGWRMTRSMMETDKKNSGRLTRKQESRSRDFWETSACLLDDGVPADEWKLGKAKWEEANSRTTGNSRLDRPQGFACVPLANAGKLLLPEKHTSHNRKNDGYQPMDRSAKNAREHIGSRRMLRSRASQCQGYIFTVRVFVRTTEQRICANGVLRKRLAKKRRRWKQSVGRGEQWCLLWWTTLVMPWHWPIDHLPLSCHFSPKKSAKEREWEMNNGCHWPPPHKLKLKHERNFTKVQLLLGFSVFLLLLFWLLYSHAVQSVHLCDHWLNVWIAPISWFEQTFFTCVRFWGQVKL